MSDTTFTSPISKNLVARVARKAEQSAGWVKELRTRLAAEAANERYDSLNNTVNAIAKAEGEAQVWAAAEGFLNRLSEDPALSANPASRAAVYFRLAEQAMRTDDTWSGRGNDARRAFNDGRAEATSRLGDDFRYVD